MSTAPIRESPLVIASHLALWPTLYVLSAAVCLAQIAGLHAARPLAGLFAAAVLACNAAGAYLLDRVKLRDAWLDPADTIAGPARDRFMRRHARPLRVLVAALFVLGAISGWFLWRGLALAPALVVGGMTAYAGKPRTHAPRLKDVLLIKNAFVASGITAFVLIVVLSAASQGDTLAFLRDSARDHALPIVLAAIHVFLRVLADAVLCDLDDERADRRYRTSTLPVILGRERAWRVAMAIRIGLAAALVLSLRVLPATPALAWAAITILTTFVLRLLRPSRLRDWVDARFPLEALAVSVALWWLHALPV